MAFDIKKSAGELVDKIKNDKSLAADFKKDPIKTVEKLLGIDLPDEQLKTLVEMIKSMKINRGEMQRAAKYGYMNATELAKTREQEVLED